jgi:hypothetical protein
MLDVSTTDLRPFLVDIWREHRFNTTSLAESIGMPEQVVLRMLRHQPVSNLDAEKLLTKLSKTCRRKYDLSTVRVYLV